MYDSILVPTDGSEESLSAVEQAIDLALLADAALHTLYVVETNVGPDAGMVGVFDAMEEAGQEAIDAVIERAESEAVETIEGTVGVGTPYRAILDYADEHDIDLIVMGTHGRTGLNRYLLGSVTEKLVRMADVPVLTVSPPNE